MGKPVVIIAELDEKYISPLEMKFLNEFDDEIELKIISNIMYFKDFFSKPQRADIMIVSEQLYSNDLQKHNIANIFVLTESAEEQDTDYLDINRIFKYTSSNEVFNQVVAMSNISSVIGKENDTKVVLFYSASGGVGRTTLALALSGILAQSYKKVLYVDAERINTFQVFLEDGKPIPADLYPDFAFKDDLLYNRVKHIVRNEKFSYLPPFEIALSSINIDFSMYELFLESAKRTKEYDYIIVDTDTIFDEQKAAMITKADKVIFVTEQDEQSVFAMNILLKNTNCSDTEKYRFICNKFDKNKRNAADKSSKNEFSVTEYIDKIENLHEMKAKELVKSMEVQKLMYLIM